MITFVEAKMSQKFTNFTCLYLLSLFLFVFSPVVFSKSLQINWTDNADNEEMFIVEKRLLHNETFQQVVTLPANSHTYTDEDVSAGKTYCYRISAFNQMGQSPSGEACIEVEAEVIPPVEPAPIEPPSDKLISYEFTAKPVDIEIGSKKMYSFKSGVMYNEKYTDDDIYDINFYVNEGQERARDSDYFSFQQQGAELDNGYVSTAFNSNNSLAFILKGNGSQQVATLYMSAGAWSNEASSIIVTVGEESEKITLPGGYTWHYFSIDIKFDNTVPVTITIDSDRAGYSSVMFAGVVLNEANVNTYAAMVSVEHVETTVDVTDLKFMTSQWETGNDDLSGAHVESLYFYGDSKPYYKRFDFTNMAGDSYSGYRTMGWNEQNGVDIKLHSSESQIDTVSLYFKAGVWSHEPAFVELIVNGKSELIELSSGYYWHHFKVDIEFEGELELNLHPVGEFSSYSAFGFAGLTFN